SPTVPRPTPALGDPRGHRSDFGFTPPGRLRPASAIFQEGGPVGVHYPGGDLQRGRRWPLRDRGRRFCPAARSTRAAAATLGPGRLGLRDLHDRSHFRAVLPPPGAGHGNPGGAPARATVWSGPPLRPTPGEWCVVQFTTHHSPLATHQGKG